MNLFLFPSITVFYYFCSFKCLFASNRSHSSYKRFHSPGPAAGSCCPDCPHPNPQDPTSLELQRGFAMWWGLPCCSQHLLELAGCWGESPLCTSLALVLVRMTSTELRAASGCIQVLLPWTQQALSLLDSAWLCWEPRGSGAACAYPQLSALGTVVWLMPAAWAPFGMAGVSEVGQCCYPVMAPVSKGLLQLLPILGAEWSHRGCPSFPVARLVLGARSCFQDFVELVQLNPGQLEPAWLIVGHLACPFLCGL